MNDKRKGSHDCSLQGGEATAVMAELSKIREYLEPSTYMSRQSFKGGRTNASPGDDAPGMAEADAIHRMKTQQKIE